MASCRMSEVIFIFRTGLRFVGVDVEVSRAGTVGRRRHRRMPPASQARFRRAPLPRHTADGGRCGNSFTSSGSISWLGPGCIPKVRRKTWRRNAGRCAGSEKLLAGSFESGLLPDFVHLRADTLHLLQADFVDLSGSEISRSAGAGQGSIRGVSIGELATRRLAQTTPEGTPFS